MNHPHREHRDDVEQQVRFITDDLGELVEKVTKLHSLVAPLIPQAETALPPINAFRSKVDAFAPTVAALSGTSRPGEIEQAMNTLRALELEFSELEDSTFDGHASADFM